MARVLIGVDGSELSQNAAARALALVGAGSDVTIAQVVRPPVPMATMVGVVTVPAIGIADEPSESTMEALVAEADAEVSAVAARVGVASATRLVRIGDAGEELCRLADEGSYDLLVVGSHGSGVLKRMLLGSVSHHVLHHAPCPVLVVRSPLGEG